jgi:uncharacterized membrane protein YoaK (UPF0700 family)
MLTLHKPDAIFSRRHVPTWLMLTFAAGSVNAAAVLACARFVTHVTGTVTKLGLEWGNIVLMADFAAVIVCFIAGAMFSAFVINGRARRDKKPLFGLPLLIVASLLATAGAAGHMGIFGKFGETIDTPADFVLLSMLSFAMGLQNAAVATSTGLLVRTTHLTGPATDLGIHLVELFYTKGDEHVNARRHALLRAGKIAGFCLGAVVTVPLAARLEYLVFFLPASVTIAGAALSFLPGVIAGRRPLGERTEGRLVNKSQLEMPSPTDADPTGTLKDELDAREEPRRGGPAETDA